MPSILKGTFAGLGLLLLAATAAAADPSGTFGVVSDIHFDPFDPPELAEELKGVDIADWMSHFSALGDEPASRWGSDTNHVLLSSALAVLADKMAAADFVIFSGDLLSHGFETDTNKALDVAHDSAEQRGFARETAKFVIETLVRTFPDKPVVFALGNTDSDCGDYEIEPEGDFLTATAGPVRSAAGEGLVAADFEETYRAGGYYAMRHPTVEMVNILVINDILWSRKYRNRCGTNGPDAARQQLEWLKQRLAEQQLRGGRVWIVHHIPWGIDAYSTLQSSAGRCPARIVPFLQDGIAAESTDLLRTYAGTIEVSFSGHIHSDDFRLLLDANGIAVGIDKIVPAISPVFGQNPGFQIYSYDVATGVPLDYTSWYLANLASLSSTVAGDWREEYVFSQAYGEDEFSAQSVLQLWKGLSQPGAIRNAYMQDYNQRHEPLAETDVAAYACAIAYLDSESFARCHCAQ